VESGYADHWNRTVATVRFQQIRGYFFRFQKSTAVSCPANITLSLISTSSISATTFLLAVNWIAPAYTGAFLRLELKTPFRNLPDPALLAERSTEEVGRGHRSSPERSAHRYHWNEKMPGSRALILFDIDGTLIRRAGPQHKNALIGAVRHVTGLETTLEGVDTSGRLDRDLIRVMLLGSGASEESIRLAMPAIVDEAQGIYSQARMDLRRKVCPGVRAALRRLHSSGFPMGLVTGNLTAIAWQKMEHSGLMPFFRFGAFAEQASTRAGLVEIALRQARRAGWLRRDTTVTLVGDHPNDILAAKLNGVRSVAVATGLVPRHQLIAHRPDWLLSDLRCMKLEMFL